ncbi:RTX toxin [Ahniella affigens]|uniref:RTX toxin n=1 Tax=Ahniella affigens TaxID=2021234 RepID=A0A2P1PNH4_9GAMM|nr:RTX toxin [Ahniella affigens]AVP96400.1 RTX toxin [Ahniella affigens]
MRWLGAAIFLMPVCALAQSGTWVPLGPAPATNGQVEGIAQGEVVGAVNALAAHPTDPDVVFAAAVNGGIWRTGNATASAPTWVPQTDSLGSLSLTSIEFDPTDSNAQTLVAGSGRTSSLSGLGGSLIGLLRTTDGGANWTPLTGTGVTLANRQIRGVAARGAILMAAVNAAAGDSNAGIYRSTDTGATFVLASGGVGTGLPVGRSTDLAADPTNAAVLYTPIIDGAAPGIYRTADTGATWSLVSDSAMNTQITNSSRTRIAVGRSNQVYVAVIRSGRLSNVYRSATGTGSFSDLGVPTTTELGNVQIGAHTGGQGGTHFSMAADPQDVNVVYLAGDRQPYPGEGNGSAVFFPTPNSIGAQDYSGRAFRGEFGGTPVWRPLTHNGTSNNSAPHADSRDMVFAANGVLLESDDGGVYRRTQPNSTAGVWQTANGNLQTTEYHSLAYDSFSDRVMGGAQDVGTHDEDDVAQRRFRSVSTGDGGDVTVSDVGATIVSTRYSSYQNLGAFARRTVNASNVVTSLTYPDLVTTDGTTFVGQFYTPIIANAAAANRLIIGGGAPGAPANAPAGVFESLNQGDTMTRVSVDQIRAFAGSPVVYGMPGNPGLLFYYGNDTTVAGDPAVLKLRTSDAGSLTALTSPGSIVDLDIDPSVNPASSPGAGRLFALTGTAVFFSSNTGSSFTNVTGNLITGFAPGALRAMVFIPDTDGALVVAGDRGVFAARASSNYLVWQRLGIGFPNAPVFELDYDGSDNKLLAGTLGRGAWALPEPFVLDALFRDSFE